MSLTANCLHFLQTVTTDKARGYSDTGPCLPVAPSNEKITGPGYIMERKYENFIFLEKKTLFQQNQGIKTYIFQKQRNELMNH